MSYYQSLMDMPLPNLANLGKRGDIHANVFAYRMLGSTRIVWRSNGNLFGLAWLSPRQISRCTEGNGCPIGLAPFPFSNKSQ